MHNRRIYNRGYRFTNSPDDAQDLTQEVFVRIYRTMGSYAVEKGAFTDVVDHPDPESSGGTISAVANRTGYRFPGRGPERRGRFALSRGPAGRPESNPDDRLAKQRNPENGADGPGPAFPGSA